MNTDRTEPFHILENEAFWAEIRTHINVILEMTGLALKTELTEEQRGVLERANNSADSLSWLVHNVPYSPMKENRRTDSSLPSGARSHRTAATDPQKRLKILLAEDNPMNQKLMQTILNKNAYEVTTAENGRAAVEAFEKESFDLILMDIQMPEMDGFEAAKRIRKTEAERQNKGDSRILIVAMTAHEMQEAWERCLKSGMDDYISKPIRRNEFLKTIERLTAASAQSETTPPQVSDLSDDMFDKERFLQSLGGNKILADKLIAIYLENLPKLMSRIQQSIADNDSNQLKIEAHSLKGMSLNLSANSLTRAALELEKMGKNDNLNRASETYAVLENEAESLKNILTSLTEKNC